MATPPQGSQAEQRESMARSSIFEVKVASDYEVVGSRVRPKDGRMDANALSYMPMARPELPAELAKLSDGRIETLLAFVRRYGQLGQARGFSTRQQLTMQAKDDTSLETFSEDWDVAVEMEQDGDQLAWIFGHARTIALVLELHYALSIHETDPDRLARVLDSVTVDGRVSFNGASRDRPAHRSYPRHIFRLLKKLEKRPAGALSVSTDEVDMDDDALDVRTAKDIIATEINRHVEGVCREITPILNRDGFIQHFSPPNLAAAIYWHAADAVLGSSIRECQNPRCKRIFIATDERMRYCPPPMGAKGVSPCMNRDKVRRARESRKSAPRVATTRNRKHVRGTKGGKGGMRNAR